MYRTVSQGGGHESGNIEIRRARENNLKDVSLRIPKRKITIFTGVSGSGKSSIVFDTLAAEAQRLPNDNFSLFARKFMPRYPQPQADAIENLNMAVIVDQKRLGGCAHSTLGTVTDISPVLRLLFLRIGQPCIGNVNLFSFNDPKGMCPTCNGVGRMAGLDLDVALDKSKSLNEGAILLPEYAVGSYEWTICEHSGYFDLNKKLTDYSKAEIEQLLYSKPRKIEMSVGGKMMNFTYEGIIEKFVRKYIRRDVKTLSERTQKMVAPFITDGPCLLCGGAPLSQEALACRINGYNIAELSALEVGRLIGLLREIDDPVAAPIVGALTERLQHLIDIGLDYLT